MTKSQVVLDRPIKALGVHDVKIALHPEVAVTVKVNVARSPEEADLQAQGVDVMAEMFERDTAEIPEAIEPEAEPETPAEVAAEPAEAAEEPAEAAAEPAEAAAEPAEAAAEPEAEAEPAEAAAEPAEAEAPAAQDEGEKA